MRINSDRRMMSFSTWVKEQALSSKQEKLSSLNT